MPITAQVQIPGDASSAHPSNKSSVNAIGARLRRKLSNNFHCDSQDSGFFCQRPSKARTRGSNHPSSCQSPRIQR